MSEPNAFDYEAEIDSLADGLVSDLPTEPMDRTERAITERVETTADSAEIVFKTSLAKKVLAASDTEPDNWDGATHTGSFREAVPMLAYSVVRQDLKAAVDERLADD